MKKYLLLALCSAALVGCNGGQPNATAPDAAVSPQPTASPTAPAIQPTDGFAPAIGTFTFDEIDLRGCGMTLYKEGTNPNQGGIYLFSGLVDANANAKPGGSMRMKLDGEIVKFSRTATDGAAIPGGQYASQTFVSEDGKTTATVQAGTVTAGADPEANSISKSTITVSRDGQEATVEAVGDAGC